LNDSKRLFGFKLTKFIEVEIALNNHVYLKFGKYEIFKNLNDNGPLIDEAEMIELKRGVEK
tara:strand:- start:1013 stop:1195 length:183 start_codon:yes stop_codon:yes gene_type:complete